ncbi:hypothetical protein I79_006273 [Cricetulus griseus]|uniref:Uncharacterized protein n=1 Tax=Cricetulus griseus TaxID=10029 RepID=G3H7E3_CRIGR|nr:hypothetical protein I79_006273 [Cricetulus griseus]
MFSSEDSLGCHLQATPNLCFETGYLIGMRVGWLSDKQASEICLVFASPVQGLQVHAITSGFYFK